MLHGTENVLHIKKHTKEQHLLVGPVGRLVSYYLSLSLARSALRWHSHTADRQNGFLNK